ncbi:hypothetical protein ACTXT7_009541 [Hymenolepis weldensis]
MAGHVIHRLVCCLINLILSLQIQNFYDWFNLLQAVNPPKPISKNINATEPFYLHR